MIVDVDVELVEAQLLALSRTSTALLIHADRIEDPLGVELAGAIASASTALIMMFNAQEEVERGLDPTMPTVRPDTDDPETCGHGQAFDLPNQTLCRTCGASENPDGSWSTW